MKELSHPGIDINDFRIPIPDDPYADGAVFQQGQGLSLPLAGSAGAREIPAARIVKLRAGRVRMTATWAGKFEPVPARIADEGVSGILVLTLGTPHGRVSGEQTSIIFEVHLISPSFGNRQSQRGGTRAEAKPVMSFNSSSTRNASRATPRTNPERDLCFFSNPAAQEHQEHQLFPLGAGPKKRNHRPAPGPWPWSQHNGRYKNRSPIGLTRAADRCLPSISNHPPGGRPLEGDADEETVRPAE